ncbi:hypothetical protein BD289DRAFT_460289 [Coniella lustricola]|uniref:C2H2-type domain-containing protein n=1 Tax=Coniella lustricola TaxID=2025994 RepID=A0A2T3AAU0_9PEZI|nr:hypothetical protein BD289DRAFT_460289 [Coniella lustricola]
MSTAALHYDPGFNHFNMGGRTSFAWPDVVLEPIHHGFATQDLGPYASDSSLSPPPPQPRSMTNSSPRMSPEHRELKRQRDQARRDSKLSARLRRAESHSSHHHSHYEMASPPNSANGDYTTATSSLPSMPVYSTAPSDLSLLTEPTNLAPQLVLPPYSPPLPSSNSLPLHSPPLPSSTSTVFPSPYQQSAYLPEYPYTPSSTSSVSSHYGPMSHEPSMMYSMPSIMQPGPAPHHHADGPSAVRVVQSRPKPQCWEHGCNGRQFSTFSNLLRHQREKSGQASKASCPDCGAEFTRTTARNGHLLHQKCKTKRSGSTSSN